VSQEHGLPHLQLPKDWRLWELNAGRTSFNKSILPQQKFASCGRGYVRTHGTQLCVGLQLKSNCALAWEVIEYKMHATVTFQGSSMNKPQHVRGCLDQRPDSSPESPMTKRGARQVVGAASLVGPPYDSNQGAAEVVQRRTRSQDDKRVLPQDASPPTLQKTRRARHSESSVQ